MNFFNLSKLGIVTFFLKRIIGSFEIDTGMSCLFISTLILAQCFSLPG